TSALGDIVHALAVLSVIKGAYPEAEIDWVVEKGGAALVQTQPLVDRVLVIDSKDWRRHPFASFSAMREFAYTLRSARYDVVIDLQGNCKSGLITLLARSGEKVGYGRQSVPEWPNLLATRYRYDPPAGKNIRADYLYLIEEHFGIDVPPHRPQGKRGPRKKVMVCPGSQWANKELPVDTLLAFLNTLQGATFIITWGSPRERLRAEEIHSHFPKTSQILAKVPLPQLQQLMKRMDLVVSMDSLPLHLAGAADVPTFSFFGPSSADKYRPLGEQHQSFQGTCPYGTTFDKRCPKLRTCPTGACLSEATLENITQSSLM
ncbi:MAG: hypothetical protein KDK65_07375, partial [Chlamydiia bacterium]|nr:hypothetical protein [Chlamydiia bacterium]